MAKIRGDFLQLTKDYLSSKYGSHILDEVITSLSPESAILLNAPIDKKQLYDVTAYQDFLAGIEKKYGTEELRSLNKFLADKTINGIVGVITYFISFDKIVENINKFWHQVYDSGEVRVLENSKRKVRFKIVDFEMTMPHLIATEEYLRAVSSTLRHRTVISSNLRLDNKTSEIILYFE